MVLDARVIKRFAYLPKVVEGKLIWLKYYQVLQELTTKWVGIGGGQFTRTRVWSDVEKTLLK